MAARRLVIVMLVLLGASILLTALLPDSGVLESDEPQSEVPRVPPPRPAAGGELVTARIDADTDEPEVIEMRVGDQLSLTVRTSRGDEVEIPGLGELEFASPLAPARFDILGWEQATYTVRLVDAERVIGRIEVNPEHAPGQDEESAPGQGAAPAAPRSDA